MQNLIIAKSAAGVWSFQKSSNGTLTDGTKYTGPKITIGSENGQLIVNNDGSKMYFGGTNVYYNGTNYASLEEALEALATDGLPVNFNTGGGSPLTPEELASIQGANLDGAKVVATTQDVLNAISLPSTARYNFFLSDLELGRFNTSATSDALVNNNLGVRATSLFNLPSGTYTINVTSPDGIVPHLVKGYLNGVFVPTAITLTGGTTFTINNTTFNGAKISFRKVGDVAITQAEIDRMVVTVTSSDVGYNTVQARLYQNEKLKIKTDQLTRNWNNSVLEFGGFNASTSSGAEATGTTRVRSKSVIPLESGTYTINITSPAGLVLQLVKGFKDEVFTTQIGTTAITFTVDDTVTNGIRYALRKTNDAVITQSEMDNTVVTITSNQIGFRKLQYDVDFTRGLLNPFKGKKLVAGGDSIVAGVIPTNNYPTAASIRSYPGLVADTLGMDFENFGISGSTLGSLTINGTANNPFVYRYNLMPTDADLVYVNLGVNDFNKAIPLGTFADTNELTYFGALKMVVQGLITQYGGTSKLIIATPTKHGIDISRVNGQGKTQLDYANAVKEVCAHFFVRCWDANELSGLEPHLYRTYQGVTSPALDLYNPYIPDGTHPNQLGHNIVAKELLAYLKKEFNF